MIASDRSRHRHGRDLGNRLFAGGCRCGGRDASAGEGYSLAIRADRDTVRPEFHVGKTARRPGCPLWDFGVDEVDRHGRISLALHPLRPGDSNLTWLIIPGLAVRMPVELG